MDRDEGGAGPLPHTEVAVASAELPYLYPGTISAPAHPTRFRANRRRAGDSAEHGGRILGFLLSILYRFRGIVSGWQRRNRIGLHVLQENPVPVAENVADVLCEVNVLDFPGRGLRLRRWLLTTGHATLVRMQWSVHGY